MTINASTPRSAGPFIGDDVATALPFSFKVFTGADLLVVQTNTLTSAATVLLLAVHYTVALNADQDSNPGGTVNLVTPLASGYTVLVTSNLAISQPVKLTNGGGFNPSVINDALDRAAMIAQQLEGTSAQALLSEIADAGTQASLAAASAAASATSAASAASARDAALIQGGIYASISAFLAGTTTGQYGKVIGSGDIAATEYRNDLSPNIYDTATMRRAGFFLNAADGKILASASWGVTTFIPVTVGQVYTISATSRRVGVSFFTTNSDTAAVAGSYNGNSGTVTVTVPATATYMVVALYSNTVVETNVQIELGAAATTYHAYNTHFETQIATYPSGTLGARVTALEATPNYIYSVPSPNLYNPAAKRAGFFINAADGKILSSALWGVTGFIPVTAGNTYTISYVSRRVGLSWFSSASDTASLGASNTSTANPLTVTAPVGANYLVVSLYSDVVVETNVQVEAGSAATSYVAYGGSTKYVRSSYLYPSTDTAPRLVLNSGGTSYLDLLLDDGSSLQVQVRPFRTNTHSQSDVFDMPAELRNGVQFRTANDDAAPYRLFSTTIGANHGYAKTRIGLAAHNKTYADVGSVWTDGSVQYVLIDIPDANNVDVTQRTGNGTLTAGSLTHVSGATHTSTMVPSSYTQLSFYPVMQNHVKEIRVDGTLITNYVANYPIKSKVTFTERYEIMNKDSIVAWLITQVGTTTNIVNWLGTSDLAVSIDYEFDTYGGCVVYTDILALNTVSAFQDIMFTQAATFDDGVDGAVLYYIPKTVSFVHESVTYDFRTPRDMTGFSVITRIDMTSARTDATGILADRLIQLNNTMGMAIGYLPILDADPSVRRTNAARKAMQISEIRKFYPACIDSASITTMPAGTLYSAVAYRNWFKRPSTRTASYVVRARTGKYLYCDWHVTNAAERVILPEDLHGKSFTVVEKSANVTVLSKAATNSLVFSVTAAGTYGYAILLFPA